MLGTGRRVSAGVLALAFVLQGSLLVSGQSNGVCESAPGTSCSSFASLSIRVTSGSCSGEASADCNALSSAEQAYAEAFAEWFADDRCSTGNADAAAEAVANAIAEVYTSAFVEVQCTGAGEACGFAISNGAAFAESTAEAAAIAAAEAGAGLAFCYADIRGLASVLATATARAQADACSTGGTAVAIAEAIASEIKTAIAEAFAFATAEFCGGNSEAAASSKCSGSASSSGFELGDKCAGIEPKQECTGRAASVCCDQSYRSPFCSCPGCGGNLVRVRNSPIRSFTDSTGNECTCPAFNVNGSPPEGCSCTDIQPSQEFSCDEQKLFGKCSATFMIDGNYCERTCGRCNCPDNQTTPSPAPSQPEGCSCTDVPPSNAYTCEQQKSFGKCNAKFITDGNHCAKTCGRCTCPDEQNVPSPTPTTPTQPEGCRCTDVPPSSAYTCEQQKSFGKCNAQFMTDGNHCEKTCGRCSCPDNQIAPSPPPTEGCQCSDVIPPSPYSCEDQRGFGKCSADWMINSGYCETTCGRCSCPGSPAPPELKIDSGKECVCSDQPPPCSNFSCEQQRSWGKCMADWMLVTDKNPDGHCEITCGRCPCSDPQIRPPETLDYTCSNK